MSDFDNIVYDFFKNYQDRGMTKWQGMMLSDQVVAINRDNKNRSKVYHMKKTMSQEEVGEILMAAYANSKCVSIQLKELDPEGKVQPYIEGMVQGYNVDSIMVSGTPIDLADINHVELI